MEETGPEETKMETKVEEATALRLFLTDFSTGPEGTVKYGGLAAPEAQAYLNDVNPDVSKLCSVCDKPGSSTCGKCGLALYCSRDCQRLE